MGAFNQNQFRWFESGTAYFAALAAAIGNARHSVCLETYIYTAAGPGLVLREALLQAARRGVSVKVLVDAWGSLELPGNYWAELIAAGADCRFFNPLRLRRLSFRNHRKLLVVDETTAFVGGFNISDAEDGDGIHNGWRDLGLAVTGPLAASLAASFAEMLELAELRHLRLPQLRWRLRVRLPQVLARLRQRLHRRPGSVPPSELLTSGPGNNSGSPIRNALMRDLQKARCVRIISAYFLPPRKLLKSLLRVERRGGDVQILLAGKSDVLLSRLASRALYQRFMTGGITILEYQAQVLHSKLIIIDNIVYIGSANLDTRSLHINYELLVRLDNYRLAREARRIFRHHAELSQVVDPQTFAASRGLFEKLKEKVAHFLLARFDPFFARQLR